MAKTHRNKKYIPKYSKNDQSLIFGFNADEQRNLKLLPHLALASLVNSTPTTDNMQSWCEVLARLLSGRELSISYYSDESSEAVHSAITTMTDIYLVHDKTQIWDISPDAQVIINAAVTMIDDMQDLVTRKEYYSVIEAIKYIKMTDIVKNNVPWIEYNQLVS